MTLHPRKSSTKKATVQSSITNYFTPNSNSRTAKAPPRASAPGRGASSKSAEKSKPLKERENDTSSNGTTPEREGFDDTETVDLVSDDEADVFRDTRPTKRTRRVISDDHEEDLFAPAGVPSSYTEVYDGPAPSTPFRTPFTLGKSLRHQNVFLPPSSTRAMGSSPLTSPGPDSDPDIPTPPPLRRPLETFRDVIPSSQTQEFSLISPRPSESVSPERPTTLSFPSSKALLTPNRHDSDDVIIPDSQASSPEKLSPFKSPFKLSSLQVRTPSKRHPPNTAAFNSSASSLRSSHSSSTTTQQDELNKGSVVPSSRTFLLTISHEAVPLARPPVPVPRWDKESSEEIIPSSQTQLVSPVRPQAWGRPVSPAANQPSPERNPEAVSRTEPMMLATSQSASLERRPMDPATLHEAIQGSKTRSSHQISVHSGTAVSGRLTSTELRLSVNSPISSGVSPGNSRSSEPLAPLEGLLTRTSPPSGPAITARRRPGPFAPTQSEESFKNPSMGDSGRNLSAKEQPSYPGLPASNSLPEPDHEGTAEEPTRLDELAELPPSSPPQGLLSPTQPLSFVERSFPSQYTQLSEGDSFRPPTESFFDRLALAETVESSEDEMDDGF